MVQRLFETYKNYRTILLLQKSADSERNNYRADKISAPDD